MVGRSDEKNPEKSRAIEIFFFPMQSIVHSFHLRFITLLDSSLMKKREANRRYMRDEYWKKRRLINMSLEQSEYQRIKKAADDAGHSPTAFARMAVFAYLDQRFLVSKNLENALWEATKEVRKIGNNVNQIARHANEKQSISDLNLDQTKRLIHKIVSRLEEIVRFPPRETGA